MKFKKVIMAALISSMCLSSSIFVFAETNDLQIVAPMITESSSSLYTIQENPLHSTSQVITGELPQFTDMKDEALQTKLNKIITNLFDKKVADAKKINSPALNFQYEVKESEKYLSLLIYTYLSSGNTGSDDVTTIVLDKNQYKQYETLVDLLGPNGYKIANIKISQQMKAAPEYQYFTGDEGFKGTNSATKFYMDEHGKIIVIFNKYEIAPGVSGMPKFEIDPAMIKETTVHFSDTFLVDQIRMLPLRQTLENLGFELTWNNKIVTITRGEESHSIIIGSSTVDNGRTIDKAPLVSNGRTFVPISYFETVLGISYFADANANLFTLTIID